MNTSKLLGIGFCTCHKKNVIVTITVGSPTRMVDGFPVARLSDIATGNCGDTANIVTGSPTVFTDGSPTVRIGDFVIGSCIIGTIITDNPSVITI